jgi:putative hemin transport protein
MTQTTAFAHTRESLKEAWKDFKAENPKKRIRDAAAVLNVSEAELLGTTVGETSVLLEGDWTEFIQDCKRLGKVMSLTRSEGCVLENQGNFQKIEIHGGPSFKVGTVIGPIEQRIFFAPWTFGFAVEQESHRGILKSFQFFDKAGDAIMKIYMKEKSDLEVYEELKAKYTAKDQDRRIEAVPYPSPEYAQEIDKQAFTQDWENMKDTHDFHGMLRKYNIHRLEAIKLIGEKWAYPVDRLCARKILAVASESKLPIMIFAGNRGNIQIFQGKVRTIRQMDNWLNVLDPDFNMHLNEDTIDSAWVVHKNTTDGLVTAVELFDKEGEIVAQFFGLRKPGIPQREAWRELVAAL